LSSFSPYEYVRIKVEKPPSFSRCFELLHIVQKKYQIIRVYEKSAREVLCLEEEVGKNCKTGNLTMFYVSYNIIRVIKHGGEDRRV